MTKQMRAAIIGYYLSGANMDEIRAASYRDEEEIVAVVFDYLRDKKQQPTVHFKQYKK